MALSFVLGAVADWSWAGIKGSVCVESGVCDGSSDDSFAKTKVSWLATFRGNLGLLLPTISWPM